MNLEESMKKETIKHLTFTRTPIPTRRGGVDPLPPPCIGTSPRHFSPRRFLAALTLLTLLPALAGTAHASPPLPVRRLVRLQESLAPAGPGNTPAYQRPMDHASVQVQPADTLLTDRVIEAGPGVQKILLEVGSDPNKAYRWVRDNIEYLPYFGAKNGAEGTAWERVGNDFDQAALLASLLRNQGVPTRFVYGVVRVKAADLANWCAMATPEEALAFLVQGGVPVQPYYAGVVLSHVDMNHVWLEARVPYTSPGHQGAGEPVWVPLDPSFKKHAVTAGQDLFPLLNFQQEDFLLDYVRTPEEQSPEDYFRELLSGKLDEFGGQIPLSGAAYRIDIVPGGEGALPTQLPEQIETRTVIWELASIPEIYQHRIRVTIFDTHNDGAGVTAGDLRVEIPAPFFASHSLAVIYVPATPEDQALADGSPTRSPLDPTIRQQIKLKPALLVDGKPIGDFFTGEFLVAGIPQNALMVGNIGIGQKLKTEAILPRQTAETMVHAIETEKDLVVGGAYALGAMTGLITAERMASDTQKLRATQETGTVEEVLAQTLSLTALQYLHKTSLAAHTLSAFLGVRVFQEPSLMLCGISPSAGGYDTRGVFFDVSQFIMALVSRDGRATRESAFLFLAGLQSSWYEHEVLASVFRTTAVSAVRILKRAQAQGITPYLIDKNTPNLEATLAGLFGMGEKVTDMLDKLIGQNQKLFVHNGIQTLENWTGQGYIIWNPENGAGGYMISGSLAGGNMSGTVPTFMVKLWEAVKHLYQFGFVVINYSWVDQTGKVHSFLAFNHVEGKAFIAWVFIVPEDNLPSPITMALDSTWATFPDIYYIHGERNFSVFGMCWNPVTNLLEMKDLDPGADIGDGSKVDAVKWELNSQPESSTGSVHIHEPTSGTSPKLVVKVTEKQNDLTLVEHKSAVYAKGALIKNLVVTPQTIGLGSAFGISFNLTAGAKTKITILNSDNSIHEVYRNWADLVPGPKTYSWIPGQFGEFKVKVEAAEGFSGDPSPNFCDRSTSSSVTVLKVDSVEIFKPDTTTDADWQNVAKKMAWSDVIFRGDPIKLKLKFSTAIPSLAAFPSEIQVRTFAGTNDPEVWKSVSLDADDRLSPDKKEIWMTVTGSSIISLGLLPGNDAEDGIEEFTSLDWIEDPAKSNHNDSERFDQDMGGTGRKRRGKARDNGDIGADPSEATVNTAFMGAAGVVYLEARSGGVQGEKRMIQNQADWLYYSGHGAHDTANLLSAIFRPENAEGKWQQGLATVIFAGCSVLDIKDYNSRYEGVSHTSSPGERWIGRGPLRFMGYNYTAPIDTQGGDPNATATIVHDWFVGGMTVNSWINANDKEMGHNACAIDLSANPWEYRYFHRVWQWIPPDYVYEKSTVLYDTLNSKWPDEDPNY